jgi:hypothetical protein
MTVVQRCGVRLEEEVLLTDSVDPCPHHGIGDVTSPERSHGPEREHRSSTYKITKSIFIAQPARQRRMDRLSGGVTISLGQGSRPRTKPPLH